MKSIYLAFQIILLAYAGFILFPDHFYISILIFIVAFEKFAPLYKEFKGRKIGKKIAKKILRKFNYID